LSESKGKFTVLDGGLSKSYNGMNTKFCSAWVTDTRLMGVLCMGLHWKVTDDKNAQDLHQFFYFDIEELGFDRFEWILGNDKDEIAAMESSLIGGLGGTKVIILQEDAVYLLKKYTAYNKSNGLDLPEGEEKYDFILNMDDNLSDLGKQLLFDKVCIEPASKSELANYFIMRCAARDYEAAAYLSNGKIDLTIMGITEPCTLYKNDIKYGTLDRNCRCEALIGGTSDYHIFVCELEFKNMRISGYRKVSNMKISDAEAYLILAHSEFITIYDYTGTLEQFGRDSSHLLKNAMMLTEHGGKTFMIFYPDNGHVAKKSYRLYDDLLGIYHVTGAGELIASSSSLDGIRKLEMDLTFSTAYHKLTTKASYEFNEPVLMQYLESDYDNFDEFINAIKID
jgi:hypothetical protein